MRIAIILLFISLSLSGCSIREREKLIEKRTQELNEKEQQLLLKEKELQLKETELASLQKMQDSIGIDSLKDTLVVNPAFLGSWQVKMVCVETNCPGSAIGDTKVETWQIERHENGMVAKANSGQSLVRVYTGRFANNQLLLSAQQDTSTSSNPSRMIVRLQQKGQEQLSGTREIIQSGNCRIVYDLDLKRAEK